VEHESHSKDKEGIDRLADFVADQFRSLGAEVSIVPVERRGNVFRAAWRSASSHKPVLLLGHLDTVWPRGTLSLRPFRLENGRAYGPGVFDMKSGILLCLLVCRALRERRFDPGKDVVFFLSSDEEIGSESSLPHLRDEASRCCAVFCLEPCLPRGKAKTFRKGVGELRIRVRGVPAHAGVDHEKGANAIAELSRQVLNLQAMTDYGRGITLNVGTFHGGGATNVVPAEAEAHVDFRFSRPADGLWIEEQIRALRPLDARCRIEITGGINRPPLERTPAVAELFHQAREVAATLGMVLEEGSTGGGSDGSFTAAMGLPTLDGLGVEGDGAHAIDEHVLVRDIPRRAALVCRLVQSVS
jgi:glutamate carboxypeptidase